MFFLEFFCFLQDPMIVGNLIFGSSAFLNPACISVKFLVHILLKPGLKDFEHNLARMKNETNCTVVSTFFGIGMKIDPFWSCGYCWVFQVGSHIECSTLTASFFQIWNRSAGIPLPPLALFIVMLPKAHLTLHSRTFSSRWVTAASWLPGPLRPFLYGFSVYPATSF